MSLTTMGTDVWGPALWRAIHYVALGYPAEPTDEQRSAYRRFFATLDAVIPCETCAQNYRRHLTELPLDAYLERGALFDWTVEMHNLVDRELGKASRDWTPAQARTALLAAPLPPAHSGWTPATVHLLLAVLLLVAMAVGALVIFTAARDKGGR